MLTETDMRIIMSYADRKFSLSEREEMFPGEVRRVTGYMDECSACGARYRRLAVDRTTCAKCSPVVVSADSPYLRPAPCPRS